MESDLATVFTQEQAVNIAKSYFAAEGRLIVGAVGEQEWNRWEYAKPPFWSAQLRVYGPGLLELKLYAVHIHENGEVVVISKSDI